MSCAGNLLDTVQSRTSISHEIIIRIVHVVSHMFNLRTFEMRKTRKMKWTDARFVDDILTCNSLLEIENLRIQ